MSYILDALKKSEAERASSVTSDAPILHADKPVTPVISQRWLAVLLMLAISIVLILLWSAFQISSVESVLPVQDDPPKFPRVDVVQPLLERESKPVTQISAAEQQSLPSEKNDRSIAVSSTQMSDAQRAMPPLDVLRNIPQLMVNSHIYSPVAEKRSVVLNNRAYAEGDWVVEGVYIKEITADGLLLDAGGWPVHVGRSKGWQAIP